MSAQCGLSHVVVFVAALVAGTGCSLTSKILLSMKSIDMDGNEAAFEFPLFQTMGMFLGMTLGLFMHFAVLKFKIPFPGYVHQNKGEYSLILGESTSQEKVTPRWMYYILFFPAMFDLVATALCMYGLLYVNVSIYQMLRGSAIIFVAILKQFALGDKLYKFQWIGVFWNVVSIILVGAAACYSPMVNADGSDSSGKSLIGIILILAGAFVQSLQYAFEEKVMNMDEVSAPPLLLIGMEGLWGLVVCLFVLYPIAYYTPGSDHGSIENPFNTLIMIQNSKEIQSIFVIYFLTILAYNILACLVTFMLNSVYHAILDNFRPLTVWGVDLIIYYYFTTALGEAWSIYSWIQFLGVFVLLYGTAIYNYPNSGSFKLTGDILSCYFNFASEYEDVDEKEIDTVAESPKVFLSTMSPFLTPSSRSRKNDQIALSRLTSNNAHGYGTKNDQVHSINMGQTKPATKQMSFA